MMADQPLDEQILKAIVRCDEHYGRPDVTLEELQGWLRLAKELYATLHVLARRSGIMESDAYFVQDQAEARRQWVEDNIQPTIEHAAKIAHEEAANDQAEEAPDNSDDPNARIWL